MKSAVDKNSGSETLCIIPRILTEGFFSTFSIGERNASDLVHLKCAPIVSADVERFLQVLQEYIVGRQTLTRRR
jgi:hypothetical protein